MKRLRMVGRGAVKHWRFLVLLVILLALAFPFLRYLAEYAAWWLEAELACIPTGDCNCGGVGVSTACCPQESLDLFFSTCAPPTPMPPWPISLITTLR